MHDDADAYPTCTVSSETDIGVDLDNDGLVDACETEHQQCKDIGVDDKFSISTHKLTPL